MKVSRIKDLEGTDRDVIGKGFRSIRPVLMQDNMGFSVHKTIIPKGNEENWHYKHHLESCYCIKGFGILKNLETGEVFNIEPDTIYSLDNHDNHTFQAIEDTVLISVFNPPVTGKETHQEDGSYLNPFKEEDIELLALKVINSDTVYDAIDTLKDYIKTKK
jgi:L-ectoine synthase